MLARLQHESAHVKLKTLNVVIALLDGGVSDEDGEADQPSLKCISLPTVFSTPAAAASVLREDSERSLMAETGSPRHAKAATAGEAFSLAVRSIMLPMLKQLAEFVTTPHEKWGDRPQQLVRGAARGAIVRAQGRRDEFSVEYQKQRRVPVAANDIVAWVWREKLDHTVDFTVVFVEPHMTAGEEVTVVDTKRTRKNSGSVVAESAGEVVFMYSNEFSWLNNKIVAMATAVWRAGAALEDVILPEAPSLPLSTPALAAAEPEPELEVINVPNTLGHGGDGDVPEAAGAAAESMAAPPPIAAPTTPDRSAIAILRCVRARCQRKLASSYTTVMLLLPPAPPPHCCSVLSGARFSQQMGLRTPLASCRAIMI